MKNRTALKQSMASIRFLSLAIVVMAVLAVKYPGKYTFVPLGIMVVAWAMDVYTTYRIKRQVAQDPSYLDQRIK